MKGFIFIKLIILIATGLIIFSIVRYIPFVLIILAIAAICLIRARKNRTQGRSEEHRTGETGYTAGNRSESTIITCDYCGSKVDTSKHSTCDHCGGPYGDDEEWKRIRN